MATVPAKDALETIRVGQAAEMAIMNRCTEEIQSISRDDSLSSTDKQARIRKLRSMRGQALQALNALEDDERHIVEDSSYAKDAVAALQNAATALNAEVKKTKGLATRATKVAGIINGVADAAGEVLSRAAFTGPHGTGGSRGS